MSLKYQERSFDGFLDNISTKCHEKNLKNLFYFKNIWKQKQLFVLKGPGIAIMSKNYW